MMPAHVALLVFLGAAWSSHTPTSTSTREEVKSAPLGLAGGLE